MTQETATTDDDPGKGRDTNADFARPRRSGEGLDSIVEHLRDQESRRSFDDPTLPNPRKR